MMYLACTLHPKHAFHPSYASWGYLWDLRRDPEPLLNLSVNQLKRYIKKNQPESVKSFKNK